jgi:hypothetical protein
VSEDAGLDIDFDDEFDAEQADIEEQQLSLANQEARSKAKDSVSREDDGRYVEFRGEKFKLDTAISFLTMAEWAASSETSASSGAGMAATYSILGDILADGEMHRFVQHARATKKDDMEQDAEDTIDFLTAAVEVFSGRPTEPPAALRSTSRGTTRGSTGRSSGTRGRGSKR